MSLTSLGNYDILDKLGEGGMGEVWRARDRRLQRIIALKILPRDVAADPARRARFEQEARALGALNHPNIVAIYDLGEDDGRAYLVSELVEGETLRAMLDRGLLPLRKALDIATQIADGMAAAHALGIVHRDLKPENVMITRTGQAKLLDFGLAKQSVPAAGENAATIALSMPGAVMGTVGYMAPEQVRGETVDARADIFSFGCVLYEMLTGQRAFSASSAVETMHAILNAEPPQPPVESAASRPALLTILHRCLEKRPEQRFQSAADLAFALRSVAPSSHTIIAPPLEVPPSRPRRRWWIPAAAIFAALALIALGFLLHAGLFPPVQPSYQRLTFRKGHVLAARFTADGRNIVYQASWEGGDAHVFLAVPGSPDSRDLDMPPESKLVSVSSNQELALLTPPLGDYHDARLVRSSISGGQARPLLDGVLASDWSPDGSSMAVLRRIHGENRIEFPIGTLLVDKITWPLGTIRVSPDGQRVAYTRRADGHAAGMWIVDRSRKPTFLGPISGQNTTGEDSPLCWNPRGTEIWFRSLDPAEPGIIYAIDLQGRRRVALRLPSYVKLFDIARNGDLLLSTGSGLLGILGKSPDAAAERDLSCLDSAKVIGISNDGRVLVADITGESGGPRGSIYMRKTDGSPAVRISEGYAYELSPDGSWTSGYDLRADGSRRFVLQPTGPGEASEVQAPGAQIAVVYGWLGGQRYVVGGHLPHTQWQCFVWDAGRNSLQPLCPEGSPDSLDYFVSPDSKQVLVWTGQNHWLVYPVDAGSPQPVRGIAPDETVIGWRSDNRSVYVVPSVQNTDSIPVSIVEITTGRRTPWKTIHPAQPVINIRELHVTPDGRAYAYNYLTAQSDLYIAHGVR